MKFVRAMIWATLCCVWGGMGIAQAQDEFDFDALLQDLEGPAETAEEPPAPDASEENDDFGMPDEAEPMAEPVDEVPEDQGVLDFDDLFGEEDDSGLESPEAEQAVDAMDEEALTEERPDAGTADLLPEADAEPDMDAGLGDLLGEFEEPAEDSVREEEPVEPVETVEEEAVPALIEEEETAGAEATAVPEPSEPVPAPEEMLPEREPTPAELLAYQEEIRRQAREVSGLQSLDEGYQLLSEDDFEGAIAAFDKALESIPERPSTRQDLERVRWGRAEADYQLARQAFEDDELSQALRRVNSALSFTEDHRAAARLKKRIEREQERGPEAVPAYKLPEIVEKRETVESLIDQGRQFYKLGELNRSEAFFERVLQTDEYNTTAMRFLRRIAEDRYDIDTTRLETTRKDMVQQVRETWNPPIQKEIDLPSEVERRGPISTMTGAQLLMEKLNEIVIPSIEFRQANIQDVINFLVDASIAGDPEEIGVNIILNISRPGDGTGTAPEPSPEPDFSDDPFGGFSEGFGDDPFAAGGGSPAPSSMGGGVGSSGVPTITLNLRRVKLIDAIRYITEVANLKYRVEDNAVIITPENVVSGRVVTEIYPVLPSIVDVIVQPETDMRQAGGGGRGGEDIFGLEPTARFERGDVKEFFRNAGVPFPEGTSISYNSTISALIVANTQENLEIFDRILSQLNVIPHQVEIEARFVEVNQNDLEELGFEWLLTDNYEILTRNRPGAPLGGQERIQMNADREGITKGLRFFGFGDAGVETISKGSASDVALNPLGNLLSFSSVLTNPEVTMILHALEQRGSSDMLSAPRVTTRSGMEATIKVVDELIYPTEFQTDVTTLNRTSTVVDGTTIPGGDVQVVTVTPDSFEKREVGVLLTVTPTVGPDGYTIELQLAPEVAELTDWIDYGSSLEGVNYRILQPLFSSRKVITSIVIWDGQTVVMGGLIKEEVVTIEDKIPFLGDIPLLGRFFRSEGESSQKQNLLIFVTARVVDPAGNPIHKADSLGGMRGGGLEEDAAAGGSSRLP